MIIFSLCGLLLVGGMVHPAAAELPLLRQVKLTHYCRCEVCCGRWSGGPTASGTMPQVGRTMAAPKWVPFGTHIFIPGIGWRIVEDRTKSGRGWDIYVRSHQQAVQLGIISKRITIRR